jgi:hypothetical protein
MHSYSDFFPGSKTIGDTIASCAHLSLDEATKESFRRTYVPVMERNGVEDPEQVLENLSLGQIHGHEFSDMF